MRVSILAIAASQISVQINKATKTSIVFIASHIWPAAAPASTSAFDAHQVIQRDFARLVHLGAALAQVLGPPGLVLAGQEVLEVHLAAYRTAVAWARAFARLVQLDTQIRKGLGPRTEHASTAEVDGARPARPLVRVVDRLGRPANARAGRASRTAGRYASRACRATPGTR